MGDINRVVIAGNLTRDPETRELAGGNSVTKLRIAVNTRIKDRDTGQWGDKPNYFDVTVWGAQGQNVQKYCQKGSQLMIDGRLEWREYETQAGEKRQAVEIIAENTRFGSRTDGGEGGGGYSGGSRAQDDFTPVGAPAAPAAGSGGAQQDDDDIPF